ncbi:hypothetical protein K501DRAFT_277037 [Backusella circina FSU 941]|nr:hypothetical protein K501DRAFT_277037 [Backusella circina FSU 941]
MLLSSNCVDSNRCIFTCLLMLDSVGQVLVGSILILFLQKLRLKRSDDISYDSIRVRLGDKNDIYYIAEQHTKKQRYDRAMEWCILAAARDHGEALYKIARMYEQGRVVAIKAINQYMKPTLKGSGPACKRIARCFEFGLSATPNKKWC